MKPSQRSSWWWAVKWPVWAAWALGCCLLTPETLFMKGSSREHCSLGQGTKGSECSFVWSAPPTHSPFFFLPLSHCWLCLCPYAWRWGGGDGLGTDSPGGAICAGVGSTGAEKLNSIFN